MNTQELEETFTDSDHRVKWGAGGLKSVRSFYKVENNGSKTRMPETMLGSDFSEADQLALRDIFDRGRTNMQARIAKSETVEPVI
jgi:hypothetical protein